MHTGLRLRRVAYGVFVLALFGLLVVPVGSVARQSNAQLSAGTPKAKVVPAAARAHLPTSHDNTPDRLQLDPVTPPVASVQPSQPTPKLVDHSSQPSPEIQLSDPVVRGPPAL